MVNLESFEANFRIVNSEYGTIAITVPKWIVDKYGIKAGTTGKFALLVGEDS